MCLLYCKIAKKRWFNVRTCVISKEKEIEIKKGLECAWIDAAMFLKFLHAIQGNSKHYGALNNFNLKIF